MQLVLVLSALIRTISASRRKFNGTTVVHKNNGHEMDSAGGLYLSIHFRWNKEVPHFFDYTVTQQDKTLIRKQMKVIEDKHVSGLMRQNNTLPLVIGCEDEPMYAGGILHKLMHALGAIHTHQRMDRDYYIKYHKECEKASHSALAPFNKGPI